MNPAYTRLAYERTVIAECRRYLMEKFLEGGGGQKESLLCEEMPFSLREVPQESIADVIARLNAEEKAISDEMSQYDFRKQDVRPLARTSPPNPQPQDSDDAGSSDGKPAAARPAAGRKGGKSRAQPPDAG